MAAVVAAMMLSLALPVVAQGLQNVELHGYMQNRFYANPKDSARFISFRTSLSAVAQLGKDGTGYAEIYYHPNSAGSAVYMESAYVDLPLAEGRIRIGKGRQLSFGMVPAYGNRKTTLYGSVSELFTADRIQGFQYAYKKGTFNVGASLFTDLRLNMRPLGTFPGGGATVVNHFAERDLQGASSGNLAGSVKVGVSTPCLQAHASASVGKLVPADANLIAGQYGVVTTNTDHNKYGVDANYASGPFIGQVQWYQGNYSFLKITGYSALVGYQPKDERRFYIRYTALNNNQPANVNQLTWDTQQLTVGIVQPIRKGVWAELEYQKNWESTGGGAPQVNNDLLFLEFFTGF